MLLNSVTLKIGLFICSHNHINSTVYLVLSQCDITNPVCSLFLYLAISVKEI